MNSRCQKNDVHVVRRRLLISGLVQGVGFRWEYRRVAEAAGTVGWARNLADGRVEVLLEGSVDAVAGVVEAIFFPEIFAGFFPGV